MPDELQLLLRQVHPSWIQQGRVSSQSFSPTPKDAGLVSVYDGSLIDAPQSFIHYTHELKLNSAGVVAVSTAEVAAVNLAWRSDPKPYPEHAVIDFTSVQSASQLRARASALAEKARQRSWLHQP